MVLPTTQPINQPRKHNEKETDKEEAAGVKGDVCYEAIIIPGKASPIRTNSKSLLTMKFNLDMKRA
jgi:hypothetical protein